MESKGESTLVHPELQGFSFEGVPLSARRSGFVHPLFLSEKNSFALGAIYLLRSDEFSSASPKF